MFSKNPLSLAALTLAALGMASLPVVAHAQDEPTEANAEMMNKVVKLDLESADLYYALKLLFSQVKADFTLDNSLKGTLVTVKINQPFKIALSSVLKASGLPITYTNTDGVYSVVPIQSDTPIETTPGSDTTEPPVFTNNIPRIKRLRNLNGMDIVGLFGGRAINWISGFNNVQQNPFAGGGGMGGMGGGMGGMGGGMGGMGGGMGGMGGGMGGMGGGMGGMGGGMGGMGGGMMGGMGGMGGGMGGGMFGGGRGR